jgi:hypothetical protein
MKARDLLVAPCLLKEVRSFVEQHHYSHSVNGVKITQCFRVDFYGNLCGAVVFGSMSTTAWKKFSAKESEVLELRRLVLVDEAPRNSESRVIGFCLRWIAKNLPDVKVIVSYADPSQGHRGVIYQASNFKMAGTTPNDKGYRDPSTGKVYHSRAMRTKYNGDFKPFVKRLRGKLAAGELEVVELPGKICYTYEVRRKREIVTPTETR